MGIALGFSVLTFVSRTLAILVVAVLPIRVTKTTGESFEGDFAGITQSAVSIDKGTSVETIAFEDLQSVSRANESEETGPKPRVTLASGTQIAAQDFSMDGENLSVEPRRQAKVKIPIRDVKAVRFRQAATATDPQWLGMLEKSSRKDVLAVRLENDQLDPNFGVIEGIADRKVKFNLGGTEIQAPFDRLEGIIFGSAREQESQPKIRVTDIWGSQWLVSKLLPSEKGQPLELQLSDSVTHKLPVDHIESIYWSGGMSMLAAQEIAKSSVQPYVQSKLNRELLDKWFGPQPDGDDLVLRGGSSVEFRVERGFSKVVGSVSRDDSVAIAGNVVVRVFLDDKEVWTESLTDANPRGFELPINKARRVRFVADSGNDGDLGDVVRVSRPRLMK